MKKFIPISLLIAIVCYVSGFMAPPADVSYTITTTPLSGFYPRPHAGTEQWNQNSGSQTVSGYVTFFDDYRRFTWRDIEGSTEGSYDFDKFNEQIDSAISKRRKFSFGVMQSFPWGDGNFNWLDTYSGTDQRTGQFFSNRNGAYPAYLHNYFQTQPVKDWIGESGDWVQNPNNAYYLSRWNALHAAINHNLDTGSFKPSWSDTAISYKHVINYVDVRGWGSWGEWHVYGTAPGNNVANIPSALFPTVATFKSIIDGVVNNFQNYRTVIITNALDRMRLGNRQIPAEIAHYAYTRTTNVGWMGLRMDHFGEHPGDDPLQDDSYDDFDLQRNSASFAGYRFDTAFNNRYRLAPFVGEPPGGPVSCFGVVQGCFPRQVRKWRVTSVGNGNFGQGNTPTGAAADSVRLGWQLAGYHLRVTGGNAIVGNQFTINLKWQNFGLTPTYEHWNVEYSLRNGSGTTVWTSNSSFDPYLFLPDYGEVTKSDVYALPAVAAGNYSLHITVRDPKGYRLPLPLQITGRDGGGSYFLTNITIPTGTSNRPPVCNAGPNQTITLPDDDAVLNGSISSDPDGTIASYAWSQVSGPSSATFSATNSASVTVSDLIEGVYRFNLTVTDNSGATSSDQVDITVNAAPNEAPVAVLIADPAEITLPLDSVELDATGSTDDNAITSYLIEQIGGPAPATLVNATTSLAKAKNLVPGIYTFRLTVSDGTLTNTDEVTVIVNAAAVPHTRYRWGRRYRSN